jgi:hypothetical protein
MVHRAEAFDMRKRVLLPALLLIFGMAADLNGIAEEGGVQTPTAYSGSGMHPINTSR